MSEEPKILASISGGKDSLAALITHIESGGRCDGAVYCRIMFDDETSAEYPEHEDFLFNKCFPTLEREYGVKTTIVQQSYTYSDRFRKVITRNTKNKGRIYGFPFIRGSWCNSDLKLQPLRKFKRETGEFIEIVGIATDETERIAKKTVSGKILPLVEHGITEAAAFDICRSRGLLSPGYCKGRTRLGCWFCHCQRIGELKRLYYDYPQLWEKLAALDKESPTKFKPDGRLSDFARRFSREGYQMTLDSEGASP